jgi:DNA polymerase (family 10)
VVAAATEEEVYAARSALVPARDTEDTGEIEAALSGGLPDLISDKHLRGDLHVHTSLSGDGRESLEKMLAACAGRGYKYVAITDHGEALAINGATREQLRAQRRRIGRLQEEYPAMTILQGAELNIGTDGSVDYDPEFLAGLDFGVASVHSAFTMDRSRQTARVIAAMHNPAVTPSAISPDVASAAARHRTGRGCGPAAVETGCALEINGHLDRLDPPVEVLRHARERGVTFTIASDGHDLRELSNVSNAVRHGRRGWVEKSQVANTWTAKQFLKWAGDKREG